MSSPLSPRIPAEHNRHDRLIVTRLAGDDSYPGEVDEARALVASCAECARLADDIRLLMKTTGHLPAPRRPRDFRLTETQVESLKGSFLGRLLRPLAAPRLALLRPLAGVTMSLGLALAVAGIALPSAAPASAPPDSVRMETTDAEREGAAAGAPDDLQAPQGDAFDQAYSSRPSTTAVGENSPPADQARPPLLYAGLVLSVLSLAVLIVITIARRRTYDRLLR